MMYSRRLFLRSLTSSLLASTASTVLAGCAIVPRPRAHIDITLKLLPAIEDKRDRPSYRSPTYSSFRGHLLFGAYNTGGVDYAPLPVQATTEICPAAEGVVVGFNDNYPVSGMTFFIAHGLGWTTAYSHLKGRFVGYRRWAFRRHVIALMGDSGLGGRRGGMEIQSQDHLHLTLYGPPYAPLLKDVALQEFPPDREILRRYVMDPEDFSIAGKSTYLPYQRDQDSRYDHEFSAMNREAIDFCDRMLDALGDAAAMNAKARGRFEKETYFSYRVGERILFLWERLERGPHSFTASQVDGYRTKLLEFMTTVPRLTAPIVEPSRRASYDTISRTPVLYKDERAFGGQPR